MPRDIPTSHNGQAETVVKSAPWGQIHASQSAAEIYDGCGGQVVDLHCPA